MKNDNWFDKLTLWFWIALSGVARLLHALFAVSALCLCRMSLLVFRRGSRRSTDCRRGKSKSANFAKRWDDAVRGSKWARRVIFAAFIIFTAYIAYPPSHWGPWRRYQTGTASYYSTGFWFKRTANGEIFIPLFMTAAHKTLPLGTVVKVENVKTGKCVYVRINDRGPFVKGRILDLSEFAAWRLGIRRAGTGKVVIYTKPR
jgi:rare lipoprotein A